MQYAVTILILLCTVSLFGQSTQKKIEAVTVNEVIKFEGITYKGDRIFGIYPNRKKANEVIASYMQENNNNSHKLTYKIVYSGIVETAMGVDVFKEYQSLCPKGYKRLSKEKYNALKIMDNDIVAAAIWYYMKTKNTKEKQARDIIEQISPYRKYLME